MPSQLNPALGIVRQRFITEVGTPLALTIINDNVPSYTIPTTGTHVRLNVWLGEQESATVGGTVYRTPGLVSAQIFSPLGEGSGAQYRLLDSIVDAFRAVSLPGPPVIRFRPPGAAAPALRDGAHWMLVVNIEFTVEEVA